MRKLWLLTALVGAICLTGCQNEPAESGNKPQTTTPAIVQTTTAATTPGTDAPPTVTDTTTIPGTTTKDPVGETTPGTTVTVPHTQETTKIPETTKVPETTKTPETDKPATTTKPVTTKPPVTTTTVQKPPQTTPVVDPDQGKTVTVRYSVSDSKAGSISGAVAQTIRYGETKTTAVIAKPALGYKFVSWSDGVTTAARSGDSFKENTNLVANFAYDAMELPIISITTETGRDVTSKEVYINGTISISNCDAEYILTDYVMEIRGRGNYTWTSDKVPKKSYRIKLDKKQNLLGQGDGKAKSWTLIANHCDQSLIRNYITLNYARKLEGIPFMSSAQSVDVYLNGEYRGVYLLCEQNQVQEYRVNITENPNSVKTGYLVEMTGYAVDPKFSMYMGNGWFNFEIKNDLSTSSSTYNAQYSFISDYLARCWSAVEGGNESKIRALLDIDSVVDTYIVEELFKNLDAGWDSFYMFIDNGIEGDVLHFGPIWDFDLSGGNVNEKTGCDQYTGLRAGTVDCNPWYGTLLKQAWFRKLVAERWQELKGETDKIPGDILAAGKASFNAYSRNFEKWKIFGMQINREPAVIRALDTYQEHYEYYSQWMQNRINWLDNYFTSAAYSFDGKLALSGSGTKTSPYLVKTPADFLNLTLCMLNGQSFGGKYFRQTADLDMTTVAGYEGVGAPNTFGGIYDGAGYTIKVNLRGSDQCIFPYLTGTVMNLITEGSIQNSAQAAGICRSVRQGGKVVNCGSRMTISGSYAGGIAASNQTGGGLIVGCFFTGSVTGNEAASPINCYSDGRGGKYFANYYTAGITHTTENVNTGTAKNESVKGISEIADALNQNRGEIAAQAGVDANQLLPWTNQNGVPVMQAN